MRYLTQRNGNAIESVADPCYVWQFSCKQRSDNTAAGAEFGILSNKFSRVTSRYEIITRLLELRYNEDTVARENMGTPFVFIVPIIL